MSVITPNETAKSWRTHTREQAVVLFLSGVEGDASALVGARACGFPLSLAIIGECETIDPKELDGAAAAIVQVSRNGLESLRRFQQLANATDVPLIAAAYDPPLAFVRELVRSGAHDVIPLPLSLDELETSLAPVRQQLAAADRRQNAGAGKFVGVMKSAGGLGATALLAQLGIRLAQQEAAHGREACLMDLDIQSGDAAFQLGLQPALSLTDLVDAGSRLDGDLLRATAVDHPSGLKVIAAPPDIMPLDFVSSEQLLEIVELTAREFGTVLLDLPASWTNWSLSLLARCDLVLLVTELSVPALRQARRQLELIASQDLDDVNVRVVVNRFDKGQLRRIREADVRSTLGRDIAYTISNDPEVMRAASEQGVPIADIRRKSAAGRDIDTLENGIAAALGRER